MLTKGKFLVSFEVPGHTKTEKKMNNKNSSLMFESLKQQFNDKIDQLAQELTQNQVKVKVLDINRLELVMKVYNEDNPYLDSLDTESDIDGTDYFIQL